MNIIQIPHSHQKTEYQSIDMTSCQRTEFQIQSLLDISDKEEFDYFLCTIHNKQPHIVFPEFSGKFNALWYDKSGKLHCHIIGRKQIIRHLMTDGQNVTNL